MIFSTFGNWLREQTSASESFTLKKLREGQVLFSCLCLKNRIKKATSKATLDKRPVIPAICSLSPKKNMNGSVSCLIKKGPFFRFPRSCVGMHSSLQKTGAGFGIDAVHLALALKIHNAEA